MHSWEWIIIGFYGVGMLFIFLYSMVQLSLLITYRRNGGREAVAEDLIDPSDW